MPEPFIGEIRMFAGIFAPRGWAFCMGQTLSISVNEALYSLIGTVYGGDGVQTFRVPDLQGRIPIHRGAGLGLSNRVLGEKGGTEVVTLTVDQLPAHGHPLSAVVDPAGRGDPSAAKLAQAEVQIYTDSTERVAMQNDTIAPVGIGQPHENMQPFLCFQFIIALEGVYPPRS